MRAQTPVQDDPVPVMPATADHLPTCAELLEAALTSRQSPPVAAAAARIMLRLRAYEAMHAFRTLLDALIGELQRLEVDYSVLETTLASLCTHLAAIATAMHRLAAPVTEALDFRTPSSALDFARTQLETRRDAAQRSVSQQRDSGATAQAAQQLPEAAGDGVGGQAGVGAEIGDSPVDTGASNGAPASRGTPSPAAHSVPAVLGPGDACVLACLSEQGMLHRLAQALHVPPLTVTVMEEGGFKFSPTQRKNIERQYLAPVVAATREFAAALASSLGGLALLTHEREAVVAIVSALHPPALDARLTEPLLQDRVRCATLRCAAALLHALACLSPLSAQSHLLQPV